MTDQADLILRTLTPGEDIPYNLLLLADETNYEDAISRSYYALYYAAKALLSSKGIITKTHKGLITQISDHYVNNGLVDHQIWHTLAYTESLRESADYSTGEQITEEISLDVIEESKKNSFRYAKFWFYDKDKFNNKFMIPEKNRGGYQQYTITSLSPSSPLPS
jgi:uncharacterized protein (UPF0332 family)